MGLFDQLAGQVMGSLGAQDQDPAARSGLMGSVMSMIDSAGGVPALLQKLKESGLQEQVASWIGTGANQAVSGDQLTQALGDEQLAQVAQQAGIEPAQAATGMAQLLPQIIDHLTPNGSVPDGDLLAQGMSMLKGKLFG